MEIEPFPFSVNGVSLPLTMPDFVCRTRKESCVSPLEDFSGTLSTVALRVSSLLTSYLDGTAGFVVAAAVCAKPGAASEKNARRTKAPSPGYNLFISSSQGIFAESRPGWQVATVQNAKQPVGERLQEICCDFWIA